MNPYRNTALKTFALVGALMMAIRPGLRRHGENLIQCRMEHLCGLDALGFRRSKRNPEEVGG